MKYLLAQEMAATYPAKPDGKEEKQGFQLQLSDANCQPSSGQKWSNALLFAILFFIISAPFLYKLVDGLVEKATGKSGMILNGSGCPTMLGMAIAAVIFLLIARLLMR